MSSYPSALSDDKVITSPVPDTKPEDDIIILSMGSDVARKRREGHEEVV